MEGQWDARDAHAAALHPGPRERRLGARGRLGRHQRAAVGDTVILHPLVTCGLCRACRAGDDMHCENGSFPGLSPRRRHGRVPAHVGAGVRQAESLDAPAGRRGAGRRGHHRLPRGAQGHPAAVPGHHRGGDRRGRPGPHRHPVPGRADRHDDHRGGRATRTRSSWPRSWARSTPWWPTAASVDAVAGPDRRARRGGRPRLRRRAGRRDGRLGHDRRGRLVLRHRLRRHGGRSRRWTSSPPSATSSATSSAPTTTWPS